MKPAFPTRLFLLSSVALLLAALALGGVRQSRIQALREEQRQLARQLEEAGGDAPGTARVRERGDPAAEARRAMDDLLRLVKLGEPEGGDGWQRAELADRIEAMTSAGLREAVAWTLENGDLEPTQRMSFLCEFLTRLARDHPVEVIDMLRELENDPPAWLDKHRLPEVLHAAATHWAGIQPHAAWDWARECLPGLEPNAALGLRSAVFRGVARNHPELVLRFADEQGIDGSGFLVWQDQTADEKLASLDALRAWAAADGSRGPVLAATLRKLTLDKPWGRAVTFDEATGWMNRAGLSPEDIGFLADPSALDLSYYIDPVETGRWIDWLWRTFPEDRVRHRLDLLLEDFRTGEAAREWLATQPEERARRIRGGPPPDP